MTDSSRASLFHRQILSEMIRFFIPGLVLLLGGLWFYYHLALDAEVEQLKQQELKQIKQVKQGLLKDLHSAINDLVILSELEEIRDLNQSNHQLALQYLQQHFMVFSRHRGLYDQIRYLDEHGMETIRVNFNNGEPERVADEALQDKSKRYYFRDSFRLERNQIFISPLDLNIEHGKIEQPYKPMIRLGMPVYNREGSKTGVILLNYFAQLLLDTIEQFNREHQSSTMLLNAEGYWLSHPDPERSWGFMFQRDETMSRYNPVEWAQVRFLDAGQIQTTQGIFSHITLYPTGKEILSSAGLATAFSGATSQRYSRDDMWKLVSHINNETLSERADQVQFWAAIHGSVLLLLLLTFSWWRAYTSFNSQLTAQALAEHHQRHAATIASAKDAIITINSHGNVIDFNPAARSLFELDRTQAIGQNIADLIIPAEYREGHIKALANSNHQSYHDGKAHLEAVAQTISGRHFPVEISTVRIQQDDNYIYTAFITDISERKSHEESIRSAKRQLEIKVNQRTQELMKINQNLQQQIVERVRTEERLKYAQEELERSNQRLAEHAAKDGLTGIANRRTFDNRIKEEWRRGQRSHQSVALILFDIDFFKRFNDNYGHLAGDECLRLIGELLQNSPFAQRASDLVARYGGEEFVVVLINTDLQHAIQIGEQIRKEVEALKILHEYREDDMPALITISLGVSSLQPDNHNSPEDLIEAADKALYRAKSNGRNQLISSQDTPADLPPHTGER